MKPFLSAAVTIMALVVAASCGAYPLDGYGYTGITRLEGYRLAMEGKVRAPKQPPGALLAIDEVDLRLQAETDFEIPAADSEFVAQVQNLLGDEADRYALAVLDLSNMEQPRYAGHRSSALANPGSVGKILIALGIFQALADAYPDDIDTRLSILRNTLVTADEFIQAQIKNDQILRYRIPLSQTEDQAAIHWPAADWMGLPACTFPVCGA